MASSWRLDRTPPGFAGEPRGYLHKFVSDATYLAAGPAPEGDQSLMHEDLIAQLEAARRTPVQRRTLTLGWVWVDKPHAVYQLAYGDELHSRVAALLLRWLDEGQPCTLPGDG